MSGHNKWSQIKRKKEATDKVKSKSFAKIGKEIRIAVKSGGPDPLINNTLKNVLQRAKEVNMPKTSIERAIERGSGHGAGRLITITYEAYGPGGAALLIDAETDNRNRTVAELKHIIEEHGGRLADVGSVAWLFLKKGFLKIESKAEDNVLEEALLTSGAEDYSFLDGAYLVTCAPVDLSQISSSIKSLSYNVLEKGVRMITKNTVTLDRQDAKKLTELVDALEEHDDVEDVHINCEI